MEGTLTEGVPRLINGVIDGYISVFRLIGKLFSDNSHIFNGAPEDVWYIIGFLLGLLPWYLVFFRWVGSYFKNRDRLEFKPFVYPAVEVEIDINIKEVLNHESVSFLFDKLKTKVNQLKSDDNISLHDTNFINRFGFQHRSDFIQLLIVNYTKKYKKENYKDFFESFKYNIKNGLLFKDGKIDFSDSIEHYIFIPYEFNENKEDDFFSYGIDNGIGIRVIVINGLVKLQLGSFDKNTSPEIYHDSGLAAYKTWQTITTYPLMYLFWNIPTSYLNLSMYATESWKNSLKYTGSKNWTGDWVELNDDIADYNYIYSYPENKDANSKFIRKLQKLSKKGKEILEKEKFSDPYKNEDYSTTPPCLESDGTTHKNQYLSIFVCNYQDIKEKRLRYHLIDYYEEHP